VCVATKTTFWGSPTIVFDYSFVPTVTGARSYLWDFGDGNTSTSALPMVNHTYQNNGVAYTVCLTVLNDCGDSTSYCDTVPVFIVGTTSSLPGFSVSVAPNPATEQAVVRVLHSGQQGDFVCELLDLRGAVVHRIKGELNVPLGFQVDGLARGIYIYRILQDDLGIGTGKLVIE
jgi:hypothetical protein